MRRGLGPLLILVLWQIASTTGLLDDQTLASPVQVVRTAVDLIGSGRLQEALWASTQRVGWGLLFGITTGLALALVAGLFRLGEDVVDSNVQILRTLPVLALVPLFILWFGIGEEVKIVLIAVATAFPIYLNTFAGIRGVDDRLVEAATTFGVGRWGLIRDVILPGALPGFFTGLRFSLSLSWLILVFAEQINANTGLGFLMGQAREFFQTDILAVVIVVYGILGLLSDALVRLLERRTLSWQRNFSGT